MLKRLLTLAAFGLLLGCTADKACTLIGCNDGLSVTFKGTAPDNFSLKLKAEGQTELNLSCPGGSSQFTCLPGRVLVNNYTPAQVEVTYTAGDKTVTRSFTPSYTTASPNGPDCGPSCKQATVEIEI